MSWEDHLPPDELLNTVIGEKYRLLERIGEGGMSVVYKALHLQLDRMVAVKIVQDRHASRDPQSMERFRQEARAASSLTHPNVIAVFDYGVTGNGIAYLVMDFLDGIGLDEVLRRERLSPWRFVRIFGQVCDALTQAHNKGIIHRDIKPSNIMLVDLPDHEDFVKILDFGIAKFVPGSVPSSQQLTQVGEILGSPLYMSPEQCMGQTLDTRSDIYSLGCVMYEAFTGMAPIQGENVLAIIYKHIHYTPPEFSTMLPPETRIPAELEDIVHKALKKSPDERWSSTSEMSKAIRAAGKRLPTETEDQLNFQPDSAPGRSTPVEKTGHSTTAKLFLERIAFAEAAKGENSTDLIPILEQLAEYYKRQGEYQEAELLYHRSVRILVNKFGAFSPQVADAVFHLAEFYQSLGRHHEAEPLLVDLVTIKEKAKGKDKLDLPFIWQCLGDAYKHTGRLAESAKAYGKSLKACEKIFGKTDPRLAASISRLATVLYMEGNLKDAAINFKRLVSIYESIHGPVHESVADALVSLAIIYQSDDQNQLSEECLRRALSTQEELLGKYHPSVASTCVFLADLCNSEQRHLEAEYLYNRALDIRCNYYGANSLEAASAYECLGSYYAVLNRFQEAEQMYRSSLSIRETVQGFTHADLAVPARSLAILYERSGQYKKAEHYYVAALEALQSSNSPDVLASVLQSLGNAYLQQSRFEEARAAYERVIGIKEASWGETHSVLLETLTQLEAALANLQEDPELEKVRARAARIRAINSLDSN